MAKVYVCEYVFMFAFRENKEVEIAFGLKMKRRIGANSIKPLEPRKIL